MTALETTPATTVTRPDALLSVEHLTIEFEQDRQRTMVIEDVTFDLVPGSTLGLVGESGSGKSVTARAVLGLAGRNARVTRGRVVFDGAELTGLKEAQLRQIRGKDISMIFQEPRRSLDPSFTVGQLISEVARRHLGLSRRDAWRRAVEMLDRVHIPDAARRAKAYPHEFSGGMCQRVMLAMALAGSPRVLIADEPTTALDVTVQSHILELMRELQRELNLAVLFITHDLGVVAEMCDRVAVMYAGQVVEEAPARSVFRTPKHPYTQALLDSLPQAADGRLTQIPGSMPSPGSWPAGCRFHTRCSEAREACTEVEVGITEPLGPGRGTVRCLRAEELHLRGLP